MSFYNIQNNTIWHRAYMNNTKAILVQSECSMGIYNVNQPDFDSEHESDVAVNIVKQSESFKTPMYAVIMHNDDYTPMDFVVYILESFFKHNEERAIQIMYDIHLKGQGVAGVFSKEIAETKAEQANSVAREEGYPLLTQITPISE